MQRIWLSAKGISKLPPRLVQSQDLVLDTNSHIEALGPKGSISLSAEGVLPCMSFHCHQEEGTLSSSLAFMNASAAAAWIALAAHADMKHANAILDVQPPLSSETHGTSWILADTSTVGDSKESHSFACCLLRIAFMKGVLAAYGFILPRDAGMACQCISVWCKK